MKKKWAETVFRDADGKTFAPAIEMDAHFCVTSTNRRRENVVFSYGEGVYYSFGPYHWRVLVSTKSSDKHESDGCG
jgi:hypothetical protein